MKYAVLHTHPENLVMSQLHRDLLFSTGDVVRVKECPTFSLQKEYLRGIEVRPLTVILWGMRDRYGVAEELGITCISVESHCDAHCYCRGLRPRRESWTDDDGNERPSVVWSRPE